MAKYKIEEHRVDREFIIYEWQFGPVARDWGYTWVPITRKPTMEEAEKFVRDYRNFKPNEKIIEL
jgi:hypothetical protein